MTIVAERQPVLIAEALADIVKSQQPREIIREGVQKEGIIPLERGVENSFPAFSKREIELQAVVAPSKMQLAIEWLKDHPEDVALTGRELKKLRRPMGVEISHKTWNDAKKQIV